MFLVALKLILYEKKRVLTGDDFSDIPSYSIHQDIDTHCNQGTPVVIIGNKSDLKSNRQFGKFFSSSMTLFASNNKIKITNHILSCF